MHTRSSSTMEQRRRLLALTKVSQVHFFPSFDCNKFNVSSLALHTTATKDTTQPVPFSFSPSIACTSSWYGV